MILVSKDLFDPKSVELLKYNLYAVNSEFYKLWKHSRYRISHHLRVRLFSLDPWNQLTVRAPRGPVEDEGQNQEPRAGPE